MSCLSCTLISYLTRDEIENNITTMFLKYSIVSYAYILHDKDEEIINGIKKPHFHIYFKFGKPVRESSIAKLFDISENQLQSVKNINALIAYFIHKFDTDKFQYDLTDIVSFNLDKEQCIDNAVAMATEDYSETYHIRLILSKAYSKEWTLSDIIDYCLDNEIWDLLRKNYTIFKDAVRGYL